MNADDFVMGLQKLMPTRRDLQLVGIEGEEDAELFRKAFVAIPRNNVPNDSNPIIDLITRYDCSMVEIGMVKFAERPNSFQFGIVVGSVESDFLVIDNDMNGSVVVRRNDDAGHLSWVCARDSNCFLNSIFKAGEYLSSCITVAENYTNEILKRKYLDICVDLSKDERSKSFYEMLIGII